MALVFKLVRAILNFSDLIFSHWPGTRLMAGQLNTFSNPSKTIRFRSPSGSKRSTRSSAKTTKNKLKESLQSENNAQTNDDAQERELSYFYECAIYNHFYPGFGLDIHHSYLIDSQRRRAMQISNQDSASGQW